MKKQIAVLIVLISGSLMAAEPNEPDYTFSLASGENTVTLWSNTIANDTWELDTDPNYTSLPEGFEVIRDANGLSAVLTAGGPSVKYAKITLVGRTVPGGVLGWIGPKLETRFTFIIRWITYRNSVSPFSDGSLQDQILYELAPVPSTPTF